MCIWLHGSSSKFLHVDATPSKFPGPMQAFPIIILWSSESLGIWRGWNSCDYVAVFSRNQSWFCLTVAPPLFFLYQSRWLRVIEKKKKLFLKGKYMGWDFFLNPLCGLLFFFFKKSSEKRLVNALHQKKMSTSVFLTKAYYFTFFPCAWYMPTALLPLRSFADSQPEQRKGTKTFHARSEKR